MPPSGTPGNHHVVPLGRVEDLAGLRLPWDALSVELGRPYAAPGWLLPWAATVGAGAAVRGVALRRDDGTLDGLAAFALTRGGAVARPLGTVTCAPVGPLARPGCEEALAREAIAALRGAGVRALRLEGVDAAEGWAPRLAAAWPGARLTALREPVAAPQVTIPEDGLDGVLARKGGKRRRKLQAARRAIGEAGGTWRVSTPERFAADAAAFTALHHERWAARGGSNALDPATERLLAALPAAGPVPDRTKLWVLDLGGRPVASWLVVEAGEEAALWLGGFAAAAAHLQPAFLGLLEVVEDLGARGVRRLDLGPGEADYKLRLADGTRRQEAVVLTAPGLRGTTSRAAVAALAGARRGWQRLPERRRAALRRAAARVPPKVAGPPAGGSAAPGYAAERVASWTRS